MKRERRNKPTEKELRSRYQEIASDEYVQQILKDIGAEELDDPQEIRLFLKALDSGRTANFGENCKKLGNELDKPRRQVCWSLDAVINYRDAQKWPRRQIACDPHVFEGDQHPRGLSHPQSGKH